MCWHGLTHHDIDALAAAFREALLTGSDRAAAQRFGEVMAYGLLQIGCPLEDLGEALERIAARAVEISAEKGPLGWMEPAGHA